MRARAGTSSSAELVSDQFDDHESLVANEIQVCINYLLHLVLVR